MNVLLNAMLPEVLLASVACVLFLFGMSNKAVSRRTAAWIALLTVILVFFIQWSRTGTTGAPIADAGGSVYIQPLSQYIKLITAGIGILLYLWLKSRLRAYGYDI